MFKQFSKPQGQAMVLWALLTPLLILFVGAGMDLGWYYLNVSRLQNAADAAALAGAQALVKDGNAFEDYYPVALVSNKLPVGFDTYENIFITDLYGSPTKYKTEDSVTETLLDGRHLVEEYARKNLSDNESVDDSITDQSTVSATDGWANEKAEKIVSGTIELRFKEFDAKSNAYGPLYYVVTLQEKIRHFFLPGWFNDMIAPVKVVVLLQPHDEGLITPIEELKRTCVIGNWEEQNRDKGKTGAYAGKWNHYMSGNTGDDTGISYSTGNVYRTESITVKTTVMNRDGGQKTAANTLGATTASQGTFYSADVVDSLNLDFQAEVRIYSPFFTTDWDLGSGTAANVYKFNKYAHVDKNNSWGVNNGDDKRILYNVEFDDAFKTRESFLTNNPGKIADPLWVRIESDPIIHQKRINYSNGKLEDVTVYNSVRQITLNFNKGNTELSEDKTHYENRPYFIFYDGPENIDNTTIKDSEGNDVPDVPIRHSQPVVINLNEDLNAIIYMPNSPVIINGNGNAWHGFIIARCFLQPVTEAEIMGNSYTFYDGFAAPETRQGGYNRKGTDGNGQTIYYKEADLIEESKITEKYPASGKFDINVDAKTGNITVTKDAPKYLLLYYTKEDSTAYEVKDADDKHDEAKTFANYINSTYKEKFKTFTGLNDSAITAVTFPDENYNETTATYWVDTSDLLDDDPDPNALPKDDKYVKVKVGNADKYIEKNKLPCVKVRTNKEYFYVCVYDLKLAWDGATVNNLSTNSGVRMIDNSYTDGEINNSYKTVKAKGLKTADNEYKNVNDNATVSDADIYINPNDKWCDSWGINKDLLSDYKSNWKKNKLTFPTVAEGEKPAYFWLNTEIVALPSDKKIVVDKYHKVTLQNGMVRYIQDDDSNDIQYYTRVDTNNKAGVENYIIVDKKGNIQTKPLTAAELFTTENINTASVNNTLKTQAENSTGSPELHNYWNTYTRDPNSKEMPGDNGIVNGDKYVMDTQKVSRLNKDYRIPAFERVYYKSAFNLSDLDKNAEDYDQQNDSYYSYFDIDKLKRVNYTYLNVNEIAKVNISDDKKDWKVDDMFFTTIRAGWID